MGSPSRKSLHTLVEKPPVEEYVTLLVRCHGVHIYIYLADIFYTDPRYMRVYTSVIRRNLCDADGLCIENVMWQ